MSEERAGEDRKCVRCGAAIERCAFCDEPDCPAITCSRCVQTSFLDRVKPKRNRSSSVSVGIS